MEYRHFLTVVYCQWTNTKPVRYAVKPSWDKNKKVYGNGIIPDNVPGGNSDYEWIAKHYLKEHKLCHLEIDCAIHSGKDSITFILKREEK